MPDNKQAAPQLESRKAGEFERRRAPRQPLNASNLAEEEVEEEESIQSRPEIIALTVLVILLLLITAIAI